jgi:uncharacterized protein DUF6325
MSIGPVELLVLKYRGDRFTGVPAAVIQNLADAGAIRVIDALFARKGRDNEVRVLEVQELEDDETGQLEPAVADISGLLSHDDVQAMTANWEPRTSAAVLLVENVWAGAFRDAVEEAGGEIVLAERIPRDVIDKMIQGRDEQVYATNGSGATAG